jgi:hypothetical protein
VITAIQKHAEAKREAAMRRRLYPRWVSEGRMKQEAADTQIAIMEAIVEDYRIPAEHEKAAADAAAEGKKKQLSMF